MFNSYILSLVFTFSFSVSSLLFAQEVEVKDAGKFSGSINGKDFQSMIRYGKSEGLFTIAAGNENFTLTVNWQGVNSPAEIKQGATKLPDKNNSVTILFVDNNMEIPFIISGGTLTVTESSGTKLKGTLEFTAAGGGIPKEMGGTETKLSTGKFEIDLTK